MKITTNNVPRPVIYGWELSKKERKEFDYWTDEEIEQQHFFRYRGDIYPLSDFMRIDENQVALRPLKGWDGYMSDSYFSAVVVRYCDDYENVVVGLALS